MVSVGRDLKDHPFGSSPWIILVALLWTHSNISMSFLSWGPQGWTQTQSGVSQEQSREREPPRLTCWPCFFWWSPGYGCLSRVQVHIARSCWASRQPVCSSPSPQGCSQSILHPACICAWDCPNSGAGHCTWPCWTSWGSHRANSQACSGSSGCHPFPPPCWPHNTACCCWQTCWGCTQFHCPCRQQRC